MKKYVLTLFVLLTAIVHGSYAQTKSIEYSNASEWKPSKIFTHIYSDNDGTYLVQDYYLWDHEFTITRYNQSKQKVWEHSIKGTFVRFFASSQKLVCFTAVRNNKTNSDDLYVTSVNSDGKMDKPKLVVSSKKNEHLDYEIQQSDDGNRFLITRILPPSKNKSSFDLLAVILNEGLNKVNEDLIDIPYPFKEFRIQKIVFDGKNKIFLQGGTVYGPKTTDRFYHVGFLRNHIIFSYDFSDKTFKETEVKIDAQVTGTPYFKYFKGSIYLVGYHYKNYTQMNSLGTYFLKFDSENMAQLKSTIEWFDPSKAKMPTGKDIGKVGSKTIKIHVDFDAKGNLYMVDYFAVDAKLYNLHNDDMSVIKLDENGYIKWIRGISRPKTESTAPGDRWYHPYTIQTQDKVYILFSDSHKNNALRNKLGENARKELDNSYESKTLASINELGEVTYEYVTKKGDDCIIDYDIIGTVYEDKLMVPVICSKGTFKVLYYPLK